ncbi:HIT family protein [Rhodococcus sp. BP-252]|uniref:Histidine triad (HIT) protein n=1 Tax=Rhodococcoides kyotonense TaxID=398843 RepID=A0A177YGH4_9NOCA|nr:MULTISPECIES: HIT family protein [Rhodococcus]MBY6412785.1 HIT family protein [Rhodococcus sp. BP-320]MBY6417417.1 HIT family protein [Rhodococcus sp. BP-321]MBY6421805.1 HIT family protein [Rhodococcus sp. BP-324]MBY6427544.1 HIT family protein [Rhodococcus sp. BP-323]MBY6432605.1 HIT family protein [Rhodococcus sp. BP-322]
MNPYTIFSEIIAGTAESSRVFEDDIAVAFMDIRPLTSGHVLVVPRQQARSLAELDPEVGAHLFVVGQKVAAAVRASNPRVAGINFFLADGTVAGQEIFHVHLHVIPRTSGDGFGLRARPTSPSRAELDRTAAEIAAVLG